MLVRMKFLFGGNYREFIVHVDECFTLFDLCSDSSYLRKICDFILEKESIKEYYLVGLEDVDCHYHFDKIDYEF
jgi:hypothetical protein